MHLIAQHASGDQRGLIRLATVAARVMAALRYGDPCLEIRPCRTIWSLFRTLGAKPAQLHKALGELKRWTSPISARMLVAMIRPMPGIVCKSLIIFSCSSLS
jgi:hypothetical protein